LLFQKKIQASRAKAASGAFEGASTSLLTEIRVLPTSLPFFGTIKLSSNSLRSLSDESSRIAMRKQKWSCVAKDRVFVLSFMMLSGFVLM